MNIDIFLSRRLNVIDDIVLNQWLNIESYPPFLMGSIVKRGVGEFFEHISETTASFFINNDYRLKKFERELNEKIIWLIKKRYQSEIVKFFFQLTEYWESINSE